MPGSARAFVERVLLSSNNEPQKPRAANSEQRTANTCNQSVVEQSIASFNSAQALEHEQWNEANPSIAEPCQELRMNYYQGRRPVPCRCLRNTRTIEFSCSDCNHATATDIESLERKQMAERVRCAEVRDGPREHIQGLEPPQVCQSLDICISHVPVQVSRNSSHHPRASIHLCVLPISRYNTSPSE